MPLIQSARPTASVDRVEPRDLVVMLESADADVRRDAIVDADALSSGAVLLAQIEIETDPGLRELIVRRLVATGNLELVRPLLGLIRSEDIALRNAVIAALPAMGDVLVPAVAPLLDDPDPAVRIAAINLLQGLCSPLAVDLVLPKLETDDHVNVCAAIIDLLAEVGGPEAVAPLEALAKRFPNSPFIAFAAAAAIKRIG